MSIAVSLLASLAGTGSAKDSNGMTPPQLSEAAGTGLDLVTIADFVKTHPYRADLLDRIPGIPSWISPLSGGRGSLTVQGRDGSRRDLVLYGPSHSAHAVAETLRRAPLPENQRKIYRFLRAHFAGGTRLDGNPLPTEAEARLQPVEALEELNLRLAARIRQPFAVCSRTLEVSASEAEPARLWTFRHPGRVLDLILAALVSEPVEIGLKVTRDLESVDGGVIPYEQPETGRFSLTVLAVGAITNPELRRRFPKGHGPGDGKGGGYVIVRSPEGWPAADRRYLYFPFDYVREQATEARLLPPAKLRPCPADPLFEADKAGPAPGEDPEALTRLAMGKFTVSDSSAKVEVYNRPDDPDSDDETACTDPVTVTLRGFVSDTPLGPGKIQATLFRAETTLPSLKPRVTEPETVTVTYDSLQALAARIGLPDIQVEARIESACPRSALAPIHQSIARSFRPLLPGEAYSALEGAERRAKLLVSPQGLFALARCRGRAAGFARDAAAEGMNAGTCQLELSTYNCMEYALARVTGGKSDLDAMVWAFSTWARCPLPGGMPDLRCLCGE